MSKADVAAVERIIANTINETARAVIPMRWLPASSPRWTRPDTAWSRRMG
jgi:hypothetical protein